MSEPLITREGSAPLFHLRGRWTIENLGALQKELNELDWHGLTEVRMEGSGLEQLDTNGALLLHQLANRGRSRGQRIEIVGLPARFADLLQLVTRRLDQAQRVPSPSRQNILEQIGRVVWTQTQDLLGLLTFMGEATMAFLRSLANPRRFRFRMLGKIMEDTGVRALGIVGLLSFLLGIVIAYQGGVQLKTYGANIFIVELVTITMLRELAPLIASIIIAGRTGSAYTAEIGTMRVTEEIDALQTLGIGPFDLLVLPKVLGLMVAMPLLTVFADILGIIGGMVMASTVLDVGFIDFLQRVPQKVAATHYIVGLAKAPVFAIIISMVGCYQGFQVSGGADSVGRQTTVSVVQSIFLVIVADAAFSIIFSWIGI